MYASSLLARKLKKFNATKVLGRHPISFISGYGGPQSYVHRAALSMSIFMDRWPGVV